MMKESIGADLIPKEQVSALQEDIMLVSSPSWSNRLIIPFSLVELAGYLLSRNTPAELLDIKRPPWWVSGSKQYKEVCNEIIAEVVSRKPAWVGLAVFTSDYWPQLELAKALKRSLPGLKIIAGNVHATLKPQDLIFDGSPFDLACIGEGEVTLFELLNRSRLGLSIAEIKGLAWLKDGECVVNPFRQPIEDLGTLPRPAYDLLNMEYYLQPYRALIRGLLASGTHVYSSRGCPYQCTFCASQTLYEAQGLQRSVRYRPIKNVFETVVWLKDTYNIDSFSLYDDTFCIKKERVHEFCDLLIKNRVKIIWSCLSRVNQIDGDLVKHLREANCLQLEFGVESGSPEVLLRMKKGITIEQTYKAFDICHKYGMRTFANVLFNTPGETVEDMKMTLECMRRIKANLYSVGLTVPLPGTPIFKQYVGENFTKEDYKLFAQPYVYNRISDPRFRLAKHNIDLDKHMRKMSLRYGLLGVFQITLDRGYWNMLLRSPRKLRYLFGITTDILRMLIFGSDYLLHLFVWKKKDS